MQLYPPAAAARDARAILLAMLTKEQQAEAISKAREALGHNANWPNESRMHDHDHRN